MSMMFKWRSRNVAELLALQQSFPTSDFAGSASVARRGFRGIHRDSSNGSPSLHRKTDCSPQNLRRSSRHCHREVRLFQELQERTRELARSVGELKALGEVGQAVSSTLDLETVLTRIVSHAVQLSGTDCGVIYEYDETTEEFNLRASHQMETGVVETLRVAPIRLGEGATGQAATSGRRCRLRTSSMNGNTPAARARPLLIRLGYRSLLCGAAAPRTTDHGRPDGLAQGGGQLFERKSSIFFRRLRPNRPWRYKTRGCFERSRIRAGRSRPPTGTSRNSSPTCPTSCAPRSTPSSASLKSWERECSAS